MEPEIEIVKVEPVDAAVMRARVDTKDLPRGFMPLFQQILKLVGAGAVPGHGHHVWIVRHLEGGQADIEVGVQVSKPVADRDGLVATRTPAGPAAHAVHIGDFGKLPAVHAAVSSWCRDNGRVLAGVQWEVYSGTDQPQEKRRCDVYHLLK